MASLIGSRAKRVAMLAGVLPHARPFGAQHQRDSRRAECVLEVGVGFAGEADPPEARLADFLQRSGEIDHPHPRHPLERAGRGLGDDSAFRRRMAVLGDDSDRSERRCRAQDGADIMRIGDLVEDQQNGALAGAAFRRPSSQTSSSGSTSMTTPWCGASCGTSRPRSATSASVTGTSLGNCMKAAASRVAQAFSTLRSGLSSAAATACLPHSRGPVGGPVALMRFLPPRHPTALSCRERALSQLRSAAELSATRIRRWLRQTPTTRMSRIG